MNNIFQHIDRRVGLERIFGDELNSLNNIDLHNISLDREGPACYMRFNLPIFPKHPPDKWKSYNTVQLTLCFSGVEILSIDGIETTMQVDLDIQKCDMNFIIKTKGSIKVHLLCDYIYIYKIEAYKKNINTSTY